MSRSHEQVADRTVSATCGVRTPGMKLTSHEAKLRTNATRKHEGGNQWQNEAA
jgi:hypothetical protein